MASITVSAEGQDQKYALENATVTLGRGLESDIRLKDIKASRRHCQIVKTPQGYQCLDLSSGNGTYVNGVQIKQQPLNPGDKIQIGSTTITFHDSNGARAAAPPARPSSGMTTKSAAAAAPKTATAQLPVAATRKMTAKVDVVKPTTQSVSRAATQPLAKPSTQSVQRPGTQGIPKTGTQGIKTSTGAMKKTTHRAPGTQRATATQKFHADARRKKSNPIAILIGAIGVIFLVVVGIILFSGSGDPEEILKHDVEQTLKKAVKLEEDGNIDGSIAEYNKLLEWIGTSDKWKTRAMEWRGIIKQLEETKIQLSEKEAEFKKYEERFEKITDAEAKEFENELKRFKDSVKDSKLAFLPKLDELLQRVGKQIDTAKAIDKRLEFQAKRKEIDDKFNYLSKKTGVHWSNTIRDWKEYIGNPKVGDDGKNKAENEIRQVNLRAREEIDTIGKKAARDVEEGKKAMAVDELKSHRGRFELTESAGALQKLIEEHDK